MGRGGLSILREGARAPMAPTKMLLRRMESRTLRRDVGMWNYKAKPMRFLVFFDRKKLY